MRLRTPHVTETTLFETPEVLITTTSNYNWTTNYLHLKTPNGLAYLSSCQRRSTGHPKAFKGSPEALLRSRLKGFIQRLEYKLKQMKHLENELAEMKSLLNTLGGK